MLHVAEIRIARLISSCGSTRQCLDALAGVNQLDPNYRTPGDGSPLLVHLAGHFARMPDFDPPASLLRPLVRRLVELGCRIQDRSPDGTTVLHAAASDPYWSGPTRPVDACPVATWYLWLLTTLVQNKAELNAEAAGVRPLDLLFQTQKGCMAAAAGRALVGAGAVVNRGGTCLHVFLSTACCFDLVSDLLALDPESVNRRDGDGRTPLELALLSDTTAACLRGRPVTRRQLVRSLLDGKACPSMLMSDGKSFVGSVLERSGRMDVLSLLLERGIVRSCAASFRALVQSADIDLLLSLVGDHPGVASGLSVADAAVDLRVARSRASGSAATTTTPSVVLFVQQIVANALGVPFADLDEQLQQQQPPPHTAGPTAPEHSPPGRTGYELPSPTYCGDWATEGKEARGAPPVYTPEQPPSPQTPSVLFM